MALASKGYLAISREATPGTAVTTPTHFMAVEEADFSWENEFIDIKLIKGSRQASTALDGRIAPTASLKGPIFPAGGMGLILLGLFGKDTTTAVTDSTVAFKHAFGDAATIPSFTLERADARSGEGGLLCERMAGAKVESVSFSASFGEKVDFNASFQALKKPSTASPVAAGSISYPAIKPLIFKGASLKVDGVANTHFKSINAEIKNTLARQDALNGSQESYRILEADQECTISATMVFETRDMYDKLINGEEFSLDLLLQSSSMADATTTPKTPFGLDFSWPVVRVARYSLPFRAGEVLEADVDFRVIYDDEGGSAVNVVMTNTDEGDEYDGVA